MKTSMEQAGLAGITEHRAHKEQVQYITACDEWQRIAYNERMAH